MDWQWVVSDKTHCKPFVLPIPEQWVFGHTLCIQGINTCNDNQLVCQHNQVTTIIAMIVEKCQMKRWRNSLLRNAESAWNSCVVDAHIRIAGPSKCLTRHWLGIAFQRGPLCSIDYCDIFDFIDNRPNWRSWGLRLSFIRVQILWVVLQCFV